MFSSLSFVVCVCDVGVFSAECASVRFCYLVFSLPMLISRNAKTILEVKYLRRSKWYFKWTWHWKLISSGDRLDWLTVRASLLFTNKLETNSAQLICKRLKLGRILVDTGHARIRSFKIQLPNGEWSCTRHERDSFKRKKTFVSLSVDSNRSHWHFIAFKRISWSHTAPSRFLSSP